MSVTITYREVREWPGKKTSYRQRAPFKAHATRLWDLLERELVRVNARDVSLFGYWRQKDFKRDGGVYADARPTEPGIILEFVKGKDRMRFQCDKFPVWLDNVDAIGRSLEALRMMDRYGVMAGQQYEGFKALPSKATDTPTSEEALETIARAARCTPASIRIDGEAMAQAIRVAKRNAHPDYRGGTAAEFQRVQHAVGVLVPGGL